MRLISIKLHWSIDQNLEQLDSTQMISKSGEASMTVDKLQASTAGQ